MRRSSVPTKRCAAWRAARWSSACTRTSPTARKVEGCHRLAGEGRRAAGRQWLEELATSRDPWFNINVGDGFYHYHRSWNDDLSMPFAGIPGYIRRDPGGRDSRAAGREAAGRAPPAHRGLPRAAGHRRGTRRLRPDDHARAPRVSRMSKATSSTASTGTRICSSTRSGSSAHCSRATASSPTPRDVFQLTHFELEVGDRRSDDVLVHGLAAARPAALAGEGRRARAAIKDMGEDRTPRRRSGRCPTSSTTRPS